MTATPAVFLLPGLITSHSSHVFLYYPRKKKKNKQTGLLQEGFLSPVHPMLNSQAMIFTSASLHQPIKSGNSFWTLSYNQEHKKACYK